MIDEKKLIESSTWYPNILFKEELTWKDGWNNCNRDWMKRIDELPKVILPDTTITGWIPCSRMMPNEGELVLCTADDNITMAVYVFRLCEGNVWRDFDGYEVDAAEITAWMPLPEPYKGSED